MKQRCGLCGKSGNLTQTECCGQWICDDEDQYVLFSYARNSCYRNHRRYTLCGYHHAEGHKGDWKTCRLCRKEFETELYAYHGTNEYNFEKLKNPPAYKPTRCSKCNIVISLADGGYSMKGGDYFCESCSLTSPEMTRALNSMFLSEQKKRKNIRQKCKVIEGLTSIDKNLFAKMSRPWPAVKWIRKLLESSSEADRWMLDVIDSFLNDEETFRGKSEWAVIHIVRILGEKQFSAAVDKLIAIYDRHYNEYERSLVDATLVALENMGPPALEPVFDAFEGIKDTDAKTAYLGILCRLGVRDERIRKALLDCFHLDPVYVAWNIADYGDRTLLPFLYERVRAIIPVLKKQIPTTRDESEELDLYIELRDDIVSLERERGRALLPSTIENFYEHKGKPTAKRDPKWEAEEEQYDEWLDEFDRRFLGSDVELFRDDEWDDDYEMPPVNIPYERKTPKIGRNDPCSCGSGKKYKKCCFEKMH